MALNCIIVDDDPHSIDQLTEYLTLAGGFQLIKTYTNSNLALSEILSNSRQLDILFTDIEMPGLNGLELAKQVNGIFRYLVFVTAHSKYALDGYDVKANAFLTKPFNYQRFKTIIHTHIIDQENSCIFLKLKNTREISRVSVKDIIYIEADGNYIKVITTDKTHISLMKLFDIQEKLKAHRHFVRIHKSFVVSVNYIESYKDGFVYLKNKKSLSVTSTYRDSLLNYMSLSLYQV